MKMAATVSFEKKGNPTQKPVKVIFAAMKTSNVINCL
jgi:hypothetical protein